MASKIEQELWGHVKPIGTAEPGSKFIRTRYDGPCGRCGEHTVGFRQCWVCRKKSRDDYEHKPAAPRKIHPSTRLCVCGCGSTAHRFSGKGTIRWCRRCGKEKCGSFTPKDV